MIPLKCKIVGNACIIRYDRGEGDLKTIIDTNYTGLSDPDRTIVVDYVEETRPDIPYETA